MTITARLVKRPRKPAICDDCHAPIGPHLHCYGAPERGDKPYWIRLCLKCAAPSSCRVIQAAMPGLIQQVAYEWREQRRQAICAFWTRLDLNGKAVLSDTWREWESRCWPDVNSYFYGCGFRLPTPASEARWSVLNPHDRCQCYLYPLGERCNYCAETEYGL